jgi:hypothetical protein
MGRKEYSTSRGKAEPNPLCDSTASTEAEGTRPCGQRGVAKRVVARFADDLRKFDALDGRRDRGVVAACAGTNSRRAVRAVFGVRVTSFTGGSFACNTCWRLGTLKAGTCVIGVAQLSAVETVPSSS